MSTTTTTVVPSHPETVYTPTTEVTYTSVVVTTDVLPRPDCHKYTYYRRHHHSRTPSVSTTVGTHTNVNTGITVPPRPNDHIYVCKCDRYPLSRPTEVQSPSPTTPHEYDRCHRDTPHIRVHMVVLSHPF